MVENARGCEGRGDQGHLAERGILRIDAGPTGSL